MTTAKFGNLVRKIIGLPEVYKRDGKGRFMKEEEK
jgi:hypothetical protein